MSDGFPFRVSVIIPVYNAAPYVTQAVESAIEQPETVEVILIEDGSPDNSLEVCQQLTAKYDKAKLLRHPNGENRGAGASRNLGMQNANCEYIAFLDADDYFLARRFEKAKQVFMEDPTCEGVYEAIGMHVEDETALQRWREAGKPEELIKTMKTSIPPNLLGMTLIRGGSGHFSLDGFVIRKEVIKKSGYMDESLRIHQDTNFIIRVALVSKLLPGKIKEPVTNWRVHQNNRVSAPKSRKQKQKDRLDFLMSTYRWCKEKSQTQAQKLLVNIMFQEVIRIENDLVLKGNRFNRLTTRMCQLLGFINTYNELMIEPFLWKSFFKFVFTGGRKV